MLKEVDERLFTWRFGDWDIDERGEGTVTVKFPLLGGLVKLPIHHNRFFGEDDGDGFARFLRELHKHGLPLPANNPYGTQIYGDPELNVPDVYAFHRKDKEKGLDSLYEFAG